MDCTVAHVAGLAVVLSVLTGCRTLETTIAGEDERDLDRRFAALLAECGPYGAGGEAVLETAYRVLRAGRAEGHWPLVGLEDLWVEALQEGRGLFNDPERCWGPTSAAETRDILGQTTIGPWQMTIANVRAKYGRSYGVQPQWSDAEVAAWCQARPDVQARMIADYVQAAYTKYGRRGPYGIQQYFWLAGYVRGVIGRGPWDKSVLPATSDGDWRRLTPAQKADTGFYAKQILVGWRGNPRGLLYWLWVTGDTEAIRVALRTWRDQRRMVWDETAEDARLTDEPGGFAIRPEDLRYLAQFPDCHAVVLELVREVLLEARRE